MIALYILFGNSDFLLLLLFLWELCKITALLSIKIYMYIFNLLSVVEFSLSFFLSLFCGSYTKLQLCILL